MRRRAQPLTRLLARHCTPFFRAAEPKASAPADSCADAADVVFFDLDDTLIDVNRRGAPLAARLRHVLQCQRPKQQR